MIAMIAKTKMWMLAGVAAVGMAAGTQTASAHDRFSFGFSFGPYIAAPAPVVVQAPPVYYAPPVYAAPVYAPPPPPPVVVYAPPVYYAPAPRYYRPAPNYYYGPRDWHGGWRR